MVAFMQNGETLRKKMTLIKLRDIPERMQKKDSL